MVNDTLVGVVGVLVIVGSMTGVIQALDEEDAGPDEGDEVGGPPPVPGENRWVAEDCRALTLVWTPERSALEEIVGPHWTPVEGPVEGSGVFLLFAFQCPRQTVDGLQRGSDSGAAALVPIQAPEDTRNITADAWVAVPEMILPASSPMAGPFERHRFALTQGSGSVGVQSTPLADRVRMVVETPEGSLEASATVGGPTEPFGPETAVVGTAEEWFSVMHGQESADRQTTGTASVETTGTTWVERLDLAPTPFQVTYDTGFSWDFTLEHEPWDPSDPANRTG